MPTLWIDNREVTVDDGCTVLDAARKLGIDIPTLCDLPGFEARTSCLVCLVKVEGESRLVPSCAYMAKEGLRVESETDEVHEARRTSLELLLSDHVGDCMAPCHRVCPLHMNIPAMLRHVAEDEWDEAARLVREEIPLAAVTGRLCHHPCETGCRRRQYDGAVSIRELERRAAEVTFMAAEPPLPACEPEGAGRVAVVGSGPAGLTAASALLRRGYACTIFDAHGEPGGSLRRSVSEEQLPREVLDGEVRIIKRLGAQLQLGTRVGEHVTLDELTAEFEAVLLAGGVGLCSQAEVLGLTTSDDGLETDRDTFMTSREGVFAAGGATRGEARIVRVMADAKDAAAAIHRHLTGSTAAELRVNFVSVMGKLSDEEIRLFVEQEGVSPVERIPADCSGLETAVIREEARRCLHCDCRKLETCALRRYAQAYDANGRRFRRKREPFEQDTEHPHLIYEPGKCVACGRCVTLAEAAGEELGLAFVGRGFPIRVAVPFEEPLSAGLQHAAAECANACPTAALCLRAR